MSTIALPLATEVADLKAIIDERDMVIAERDASLAALRGQLVDLRKTIAAQNKDLNFLRREFEKLGLKKRGDGHLIDEGQQVLFGDVGPQEPEPEEIPEHANEAPDGETANDQIKGRYKPKKSSRGVDKSRLERVLLDHELPEDERICPVTGAKLIPIGVIVTEELDFVGATLRILVHRQVKYGLAPDAAEERRIEPLLAPRPPQALEGCRASASLIGHLLVLKYMFHMPLYRQVETFRQAGLAIARQTLCDWVLKGATALSPIARAIEIEIRAGPVLQLDDTPVKRQGGKGHGLSQSYLWTFVNPAVGGVVFRFTKGRSAADLAPLLVGSSASILLGDAYAGNKAAAREAGLKVEHAGCWAHVVRKFRDARKEAGAMVLLFRDDFKALYAVEDEASERGLDNEQRAELRQAKAGPIIVRVLRRTLGWKDTFSLSGSMGAAMKYLRNSRQALTAYLKDGGIPIDNNACERSIRPVAVGRRNWLFAGSVRGGEAAAVIYTLIECCKIADVDPEVYLADVIIRVATHPASKVSELTPERWAAARTAENVS